MIWSIWYFWHQSEQICELWIDPLYESTQPSPMQGKADLIPPCLVSRDIVLMRTTALLLSVLYTDCLISAGKRHIHTYSLLK